MEKNKKRPVYLNLLKIRLPAGGMVSILHRITGVLLAALLPVSVYLLQRSLRSETGFEQLSALASTPVARLGSLIVLWVFSHHFFAGVRHLLMDLDIGLGRASGRAGAWLVFAAGAAPVLYAAVRLL